MDMAQSLSTDQVADLFVSGSRQPSASKGWITLSVKQANWLLGVANRERRLHIVSGHKATGRGESYFRSFATTGGTLPNGTPWCFSESISTLCFGSRASEASWNPAKA